ncbi:hypothetical protein DFS34DRAFT_683802 [Phlyctochytrium arcticum]|nr:hypothetical protein DFS34DRAFT_683802 [Phlyctochytrium arcticum]
MKSHCLGVLGSLLTLALTASAAPAAHLISECPECIPTPVLNRCHITTSCIGVDLLGSNSTQYFCACRPGFKANALHGDDSIHWRAEWTTGGHEHRVFVVPGTSCDTGMIHSAIVCMAPIKHQQPVVCTQNDDPQSRCGEVPVRALGQCRSTTREYSTSSLHQSSQITAQPSITTPPFPIIASSEPFIPEETTPFAVDIPTSTTILLENLTTDDIPTTTVASPTDEVTDEPPVDGPVIGGPPPGFTFVPQVPVR